MARLLDGTVDIPTAGTRVQISNTRDKILWIYLFARAANTNNVWVGASTIAANRGRRIAAAGTAEITPATYDHTFVFNTLWADTDTNGNDIDWIALVE